MITLLSDYITQERADLILNGLTLSPVKEKIQERPNELGDFLYLDAPFEIQKIMEQLYEDTIFAEIPDAVTIHEYLPGQYIHPHIDDVTYGDVVAVVTLKGTAPMLFEQEGSDTLEYLLEPRSLLFFSGEERESWTHYIPPTKEVRISLVIRKQKF